MTAWQVASLPFLISGACFCCGIAMGFGLSFLMISAWMWH